MNQERNHFLPTREILKTEITDIPKVAGEYLKKGKIVIFPTETVYGMGASSLIPSACKYIYKIKNRPSDNPFIIHFSSIDEIEEYAHLTFDIISIIKKLSPGPISYILKKKKEIFSSELQTIGVRIPSNILAQEMLKISGPVSAPSANLSGKPSITKISDIKDSFIGKVDCILEGGDCIGGIESTVIDLSVSHPKILRPGLLSIQEIIKELDGLKLEYSEEVNKSPGTKYRHYSPDCIVKMIEDENQIVNFDNSAFIGFKIIQNIKKLEVVNNNKEYIYKLYSFFIECEKENIEIIYCQKPIDDNDSYSLLNRLSKAVSKN
jgi:L-threonylcarbamoyladenylate synthase